MQSQLLKKADTGTDDFKNYNNGFIDGIGFAINELENTGNNTNTKKCYEQDRYTYKTD